MSVAIGLRLKVMDIDRVVEKVVEIFEIALEKIISMGKLACDGCRAAFLNCKKREEANWVSRRVKYLELTVKKDFQKQFMGAMQIPLMTDSFPRLEGLVPDEILDPK